MYITHGTLKSIRGHTAATDFSVSVTPTYTPVGGSSGPITDKDSNVNHVTGGTTQVGFTASVLSPTGDSYAVTNETPAIASLSGLTAIPLVPYGTCSFTVTVGGAGTRRYSQVVSSGSYVSVYTLTSYVSGSLARHHNDYLASLVAAHPAMPTVSEFQRHTGEYGGTVANPAGARNGSLWCGALDLGAVSFSRHVTSYGSQADSWGLPLTLVHTGSDSSTRFALVAAHTAMTVGYLVNFLRGDGSFAQATVQSVTTVGTDLQLVYFTAAVTGIEPVKTLGAGWESKLPCVAGGLSGYGVVLPTLYVGGRLASGAGSSNVRIGRLSLLPSSSGTATMGTVFATDQTWLAGLYNQYTWAIDVGDSSGPHFLRINGKWVLLGLQYQVGSCSSVPSNKTAIDAAMTAIAGTPTALSTQDISMFTTF